MKRNLSLFAVLLLLLVGTYIFQEQRSQDEYIAKKVEGQIFKSEIKKLKLPNVSAEKINGIWKDGDKQLSYNSFKLIERKLSEIRKIKSITGDWKSFFPNPFNFEVNGEEWTIGDMSLDKQAFYIGKKNEIYLAEIEGESVELTRDENEIAAIKLNELVAALSKSKEDLIENQLFRFYHDMPLERVIISVEGHLPFELDFKNDTTLPPPISGIKVHKDLRGKFYSILTQATILQELPYDEKYKFSNVGKIHFIAGSKKVDWELWLTKKDSADAIIIDPGSKRAFKMAGGTLKIFFINVQDYWDKKIIPSEDFKTFNKLPIEFIQGKKSANVILYNREPLKFEVKGYNPDQAKLEELIHFLFNLESKDQADRVSQLTNSEKKQLLSEGHLKINIMDQDLILWRKKEELIVVNLTQGFKAHFALLNENFRGTFEDMLK